VRHAGGHQHIAAVQRALNHLVRYQLAVAIQPPWFSRAISIRLLAQQQGSKLL